MTIVAWICFGLFAFIIMGFAIGIAISIQEKWVWIISPLVGLIVTILVYAAIHWLCINTAVGQRALKTQKSNFDGGLNRIVTVYSYDGDIIKSWEGQFDVTENDQETWFDVDGRRVIIQGGIIINEEVENSGTS